MNILSSLFFICSASLAHGAPNYLIIEEMVQENQEIKKRVAEWVFDHAVLSAKSWDLSLLRYVLPVYYADTQNEPEVLKGRHALDSVVRDYGVKWKLKTIQTQNYWLLIAKKTTLGGDARLFATKMIHLPGVKWRFESNWKTYQVYRCILPAVPVDLPGTLAMSKYERSMWAKSMRIFEGREWVLIYIEKLYPEHPFIIDSSLDANQRWFTDIRNAKDKRGRPQHPRWWEFWHWHLFN